MLCRLRLIRVNRSFSTAPQRQNVTILKPALRTKRQKSCSSSRRASYHTTMFEFTVASDLAFWRAGVRVGRSYMTNCTAYSGEQNNCHIV